MKILVVEDSALLRRMYHLAFPRREHELDTAEGGRQALDLLAESRPPHDIILLDLRMPDMSGVEFIRTMRRGAARGGAPIVVTTAEPDDSHLLREAKALGVAAVVKKPWKPQQLRAVVQAVLDQLPG